MVFSRDNQYSITNIHRVLNNYGYCRDKFVLDSGTFSQKGDSLFIWPVNLDYKIRIDFFGNSIERINNLATHRLLKSVIIKKNSIVIQDGEYFPGSYIVHPYHGIGLFQTNLIKQIDAVKQKFIHLEYAKNDRLFFPKNRENELMVYIGNKKPRLTRLNSDSWQNTKKRVTKNLIVLAQELLDIYAQRSAHQREPFPNDRSFLTILEKSFEYKLTLDQEKALDEIIKNLTTKNFPQDHLLVGDVGFGKTEVAIRAASIVLAAGKQVALLSPTTVLSAQHEVLLIDRFKNLPIRIGQLSRFNKARHNEIINQINNHQIDFIVGTHKLLSEQINFENLGLLIIDEEQRFGVKQKEKLKKLKTAIDIISLSATPIPRTLFMSLSGLRSLSLINMPPVGRKGVSVAVEKFNPKILLDYLKRELSRNGQIYYIHNRVQSIHAAKNRLMKLLDSIKIANQLFTKSMIKDDSVVIGVAHGQLSESALSETMNHFLIGDIDILLSSTIVENGLDHPNANTIIIDNAERFGLSDLYQLRGRIGRRNRKAYALLMIGGILNNRQEETNISATARERLKAIAEIEAIGGGWQLALKDLEIRGSGNLLGRQQHGYMEAVGLLLYSKLLKEAIDQVKKEELKKHLRAQVNNGMTGKYAILEL